MTLKDKLTQLNVLFNSLKTKLKSKLEKNQKTLTQTQTKLNESNHKLELQLKETSENEKVLTQLMQEFEELAKELN